MRRALPFAFAILAAAASAQEPDFDAIDRKIRFRIDAAGQVLMAPDPDTGDAEAFVPLAVGGVGVSMTYAGLLGWLNFVAAGPTDFASLADAPRHFERLGHEDAQILQAIAGTGAAPAGFAAVLERLLAVRAAERTGLKAALPLVERLADDASADRFVRRAALEASQILRGEPRPPLSPKLPPLAGVLARIPADADFVLRVDGWRMPSATGLGSWARRIAGSVSRSMQRSGITFGELDYVAGIRNAEMVGVLPYEIARRYGNHRIDRVVMAMRIPVGGMAAAPRVWAIVDGEFDVDRVRAGLEADGMPQLETSTSSQVEVQLGAGFRLAVGPERIRVWHDEFRTGADDGARSDALRAIGDPVASVGLWISPDVDLPDEVARLRPDWLTLQVPPSARGQLILNGAWPDPTGAAAFRVLLLSGPGFIGRAADEVAALDPVADAFDELEAEVQKERLTASMPIPQVDVGDVIAALIESGMLR